MCSVCKVRKNGWDLIKLLEYDSSQHAYEISLISFFTDSRKYFLFPLYIDSSAMLTVRIVSNAMKSVTTPYL